jgi:hypothetical protein
MTMLFSIIPPPFCSLPPVGGKLLYDDISHYFFLALDGRGLR